MIKKASPPARQWGDTVKITDVDSFTIWVSSEPLDLGAEHIDIALARILMERAMRDNPEPAG